MTQAMTRQADVSIGFPQSAPRAADLHAELPFSEKRQQIEPIVALRHFFRGAREGSARVGRMLLGMAVLARSLCALLVAALSLPRAAHAAPCSIDADFDGAAVDGVTGWSEAATALSELALTDDDCVSLRIEPSSGGARVLFTTKDGRTAERYVATPEELKPTVDALRVQAPAAAPEPAPQPTAAPAEPVPASTPQPEPAERANDDDAPIRFALFTGARGGADSLVSPLLSTALSLTFRHLELGATLSSELQYVDVQGMRPADRQTSTAALGLHAGARSPWGAADVLAGGRVAIATLLTRDHESRVCPPDMMASCPLGEEDERVSEWRFGAYAGFAIPRDSSLRFRTEIGGELATPGPGTGTLPLTPSWALSALVGLELEP